MPFKIAHILKPNVTLKHNLCELNSYYQETFSFYNIATQNIHKAYYYGNSHKLI